MERYKIAATFVVGVFVTLGLNACATKVTRPLSFNGECVVLLHGLGRTRNSMNKMQRHLSEAGYLVVNYDYPSTRYSISELAATHVPRARASCETNGARKIHFVTHSMGGIVVRQYLQDHQLPAGSRVVMLAPPNQGSEVVDRFKNNIFFKWITGPAGQELGTDANSVPNRLGAIAYEVGILTGNNNKSETFFSSIVPGDDDGKVSVQRAKLEGMEDFMVVETGHTSIMKDPVVLQQVVHFLRYARFDRSGISAQH